jgi:hypothetical protein
MLVSSVPLNKPFWWGWMGVWRATAVMGGSEIPAGYLGISEWGMWRAISALSAVNNI